MKVKAPQILVLLAGLCFFAFVGSINAVPFTLTVGGQYYLGEIVDGIPSSAALEVSYIKELIKLPDEQAPIAVGTETYNRIGSTVAPPFPDPTTNGSVKDEDKNPGFDNVIDATGYQYILAKFGSTASLVWFLSGTVGEVEVPQKFGTSGGGLSHISLYNGNVPDGGSALLLLGMAIIGLGALQHRFQKR